MGQRTSLTPDQLKNNMTPGNDLGSYLRNFAAEYGRKYGGVGFPNAMHYAEAGFLSVGTFNNSTLAAEVDRIFNMLKPQGTATA